MTELRQRQRLTQDLLAKQLGCSRTRVAALEAGTLQLTEHDYRKLSEVFHRSVADLRAHFGEADDRPHGESDEERPATARRRTKIITSMAILERDPDAALADGLRRLVEEGTDGIRFFVPRNASPDEIAARYRALRARLAALEDRENGRRLAVVAEARGDLAELVRPLVLDASRENEPGCGWIVFRGDRGTSPPEPPPSYGLVLVGDAALDATSMREVVRAVENAAPSAPSPLGELRRSPRKTHLYVGHVPFVVQSYVKQPNGDLHVKIADARVVPQLRPIDPVARSQHGQRTPVTVRGASIRGRPISQRDLDGLAALLSVDYEIAARAQGKGRGPSHGADATISADEPVLSHIIVNECTDGADARTAAYRILQLVARARTEAGLAPGKTDFDAPETLEEAQVSGPHIVVAIRNIEATENVDHLADACDGILLAPGQLSKVLDPTEVPRRVEGALLKGRARGKIVIAASQVADSLRSTGDLGGIDASDTFLKATEDVDAILLSLVGSWQDAEDVKPSEAIDFMVEALRATSGVLEQKDLEPSDAQHLEARGRAIVEASTRAAKAAGERVPDPPPSMPAPERRFQRSFRLLREQRAGRQPLADHLTLAAVRLSTSLDNVPIVIVSQSGRTVRALSRFMPEADLLAIVHSPLVARKLSIVRGVQVAAVVDLAVEDRKTGQRRAKPLQFANELIADLKSHPPKGLPTDVPIVYLGGSELGKVGQTNLLLYGYLRQLWAFDE